MESRTFADPEVSQLMNGFFVNYRLDAEGAYRSVAKSLEVKQLTALERTRLQQAKDWLRRNSDISEVLR